MVIVTPAAVRGVALTGIAGGFRRLGGAGGAERRPEGEGREKVGDEVMVGVAGTLAND